jgi:hypothetical protein
MEADVCGYLEEVDTVSEVVEIPDRQQPHFSNIPSGFAGGGRPSPNSIGTNARVPSAGWRSAGMDGCLNPTGSGCLGATPGGCLYLPMRGCSLPGCGGIIAIVVLIYFILGLFGLLYNALSIGVFYLSPFLTQIITVGLGILLLVLFIGLLWVTISRGSSKTERIIAAIILIALLALMSIFFIGNLQPNNINLDFSDGQLLFISQSHLTLYPNL